jgi:hypothetical protein
VRARIARRKKGRRHIAENVWISLGQKLQPLVISVNDARGRFIY